jgi:dihydrofolate reductase
VSWTGSRLVKGNVADEVRRLRQSPGKDLLLAGSGQLFNALMQDDLIDLYRFMVHPIVLGKGKRLFTDGSARRVLELTDTKRFASGIVIAEYRSAKAA